jgi:hypothetical protein
VKLLRMAAAAVAPAAFGIGVAHDKIIRCRRMAATPR